MEKQKVAISREVPSSSRAEEGSGFGASSWSQRGTYHERGGQAVPRLLQHFSTPLFLRIAPLARPPSNASRRRSRFAVVADSVSAHLR